MSANIGTEGQSHRGYVGVAQETEYGEGAEPEEYVDIVTDGFSGDNQPITIETIRDRGASRTVAGAFEDEGSLDLPVDPEGGLGILLKAGFGDAEVEEIEAGEVGQHTFTPADMLPSLCVEIGLGGMDPVWHTGVGADVLEFEHASEEELVLSADLPAKEPELQDTRTTPAYSDLRPFVFHDGTFEIDGDDRSVDVSEVTWSLTNNIEKRFNDNRTPRKMIPGQREVTANVTMDFENRDTWRKFLGASDADGVQDELYKASFTATWESPEQINGTDENYSLELEMPHVDIRTHQSQLDGNDLIAEEVELGAVIDPEAGFDVQATLVNGVTEAY